MQGGFLTRHVWHLSWHACKGYGLTMHLSPCDSSCGWPGFPHKATVLGLGDFLHVKWHPHRVRVLRDKEELQGFSWSSSEITLHHFRHTLLVTNAGYRSSPHSACEGTPQGYESQKAPPSKEGRGKHHWRGAKEKKEREIENVKDSFRVVRYLKGEMHMFSYIMFLIRQSRKLPESWDPIWQLLVPMGNFMLSSIQWF